jgi:hypothetical protein
MVVVGMVIYSACCSASIIPHFSPEETLSMPNRCVFLALLLVASAACDRAPSTPMQPPGSTSAAPAPSMTSPAALSPVDVPEAAAAGSVGLPAEVPVASGASPSTPPIASSPTLTPSPAPSVAPPLPHVRVENIGMHIGGGPNEAADKAPIAGSVAPHFDEVRACWTHVDDASRGGDFGVDLLIQPEGGRAKVSHPRTAIHPDAFRDCVVAVFEQIDFRRPKKGLTMVSYSLRFTP